MGILGIVPPYQTLQIIRFPLNDWREQSRAADCKDSRCRQGNWQARGSGGLSRKDRYPVVALPLCESFISAKLFITALSGLLALCDLRSGSTQDHFNTPSGGVFRPDDNTLSLGRARVSLPWPFA
ncbi:hypothetical protein NQZ68_018964 [Dissostichus eleginoides]|nr:hypothetical protein NQZ68_018964 [Dissostichus eleginoides]